MGHAGAGRPDEDRRGGFQHRGWATAYADPVLGRLAGEGMTTAGDLLLGRRTYEDFYSVWPDRTDNPFTAVLDNSLKYVASKTLKGPLPWMNSTLLKGDAADAVAALKRTQGVGMTVLGSGDLVQSLIRRNLVDRYVLMIHPIVLGSGRRLFDDGAWFAGFGSSAAKHRPLGWWLRPTSRPSQASLPESGRVDL